METFKKYFMGKLEIEKKRLGTSARSLMITMMIRHHESI